MAPYPSGKGAVCKTVMHQFDSDWCLLEAGSNEPVFLCPELARLFAHKTSAASFRARFGHHRAFISVVYFTQFLIISTALLRSSSLEKPTKITPFFSVTIFSAFL